MDHICLSFHPSMDVWTASTLGYCESCWTEKISQQFLGEGGTWERSLKAEGEVTQGLRTRDSEAW